MQHISRRAFLKATGALAAAPVLATATRVPGGPFAASAADPVCEVLNPRMRVPLSFIIDDSTCLVNMGRFCMPQFEAAWPDRAEYKKPWKSWPAEIPDAFLREFGQWCATQGVKGKFSVVPAPACVGWLDRELPGWSRGELLSSLQLVRELMVPDWDIHPEMITHTRVIDVKSGRPLPDISPATMENSYPQTKVSVDELTEYLAYALRILKNCDLPCEGITTPGGFGGNVKSELSLAVQQSVSDVFAAEIPHYFKYVADGNESTQPRIEHLRGGDNDGSVPQLTVSIYAGTGDWFGGWDGDERPQGDRYCNRDATQGRMVELIERGEPAIMLCHWPGMYTHGTKQGFADFQQVVLALNQHKADQTIWMKLSEIARYWTARQLTRTQPSEDRILLKAPFACPQFTVRLPARCTRPPTLVAAGHRTALRSVASPAQLQQGTWLSEPESCVACFDLPRGESEIQI